MVPPGSECDFGPRSEWPRGSGRVVVGAAAGKRPHRVAAGPLPPTEQPPLAAVKPRRREGGACIAQVWGALSSFKAQLLSSLLRDSVSLLSTLVALSLGGVSSIKLSGQRALRALTWQRRWDGDPSDPEPAAPRGQIRASGLD